ncbi:tetratricopeptide repeat protein [Caldisericum sp.]|uniref:tetratricopeptide repeat protein n=1 Tax=Caldisericum sp. TaxID=2499687 RepID=UPI003D12199C
MEEKLKKIFEENFYSFRGLFSGIVLIILAIILHLDLFLEKGIPDFKIRLIIYAVFLAIWAISWWCSREYLPSNPKGKVGLLLAIGTESDKQKVRTKNDLAEGIKKLLGQHNLSHMVNVIVLEDFKANKVSEIMQKYLIKKDEVEHIYINLDTIEKERKLKETKEYRDFIKLNRKLNCRFYVWGKIKERQDIENKYFIDLEVLVLHKPLEQKPAEGIKKEFALIFPKEVSFLEKIEAKGFELTSDMIFIAAMYITGDAAFLSGDPFTAYELHKNLQTELNRFQPLPPNLQNMSNNLKIFLSAELFEKAKYSFVNKDLVSAKKFLNEAESINNKNYDLLVSISYFAFNLEKDVSKSLEYLKRASEVGVEDYTWLYNRAFIYMYVGEYEKGLKNYKKLLEVKFLKESKIVDECIEYNKNLIKNEQDKYQLLFIIGYLYYFKKNDLINALKYFELFKDKVCIDISYAYLYTRADTYISEIKKKLS